MGFLEEIAEQARQVATGDNWFYKREPYVLELRSSLNPKTGLVLGQAFMTMALGPQNYSVKRVYRQSVTPTLGGLVAEERGLLWRMITVSGTFGLGPKFAFDTSITPDPSRIVPGIGLLSGPGWTRRMVRNYFDKYAALKADPEVAGDTQMIWHDMKTDDHWIVVPEEITIDRSSSSRRLQYPFTFRLKATAEADAGLLKLPISDLGTVLSAASTVQNVSNAVATIESATFETSNLLTELRYFVPGLDLALEKADSVRISAKAFTAGDTATVSIGRDAVLEAGREMQAVVDSMEEAPEVPASTRAMFHEILDAIDAIAAQNSAFGTTYQQLVNVIAPIEAAANDDSRADLEARESDGAPSSVQALDLKRGRAQDINLVDANALPRGRSFASYNGFRDYTVKAVDTLQSIASRLLGDGALWYDIAIVNGLKPPYITPEGAPGTVRPGDIIGVPLIDGAGANSVASGSGSEPGQDLLGTDFALEEVSFSAPGRPVVDWAIDERTNRDAKLITGFDNLGQALQMRTWTERGSLPLLPEYGQRRAIGIGQTGAFLALLRLHHRENVAQDSRVIAITSVRMTVTGDLVELDSDVVPLGAENARTISTAVV